MSNIRSSYTQEDIKKIINNCEILILPDEASLVEEEPCEENDSSKCQEVANIKNEHPLIFEENTDNEAFESIYQNYKSLKQKKKIYEPTYEYTNLISSDFDDTNSDADLDKAFRFNEEVKVRLLSLKTKLLKLSQKVEERFRVNSTFLEEVKTNDLKDALSFKSTYSKCGSPFFKDALGYPAPENEDFKFRKNVLHEFFPFELIENDSRWKTSEKIALIIGVKKQMIDYIKLQQSRKICLERKGSRSKFQKLKHISSNQDLNMSPMIEIYNTISEEHPEFGINWNLISFGDLQSAHSVTECMGMWYSYLKPDINREPFSDEENLILSEAVVEYDYQNWEEISAKLKNRSSLQTFVYFHSTFTRQCLANRRWSSDEDAQLLEAVRKNTIGGSINWGKVGGAISGRNKTQCYNRYLIIMRHKNVKRGIFSPRENRILLSYVSKHGEDFHKMPKELLPNRSIVQIKNHYEIALKHRGKVNPWTSEEDQTLMDFVSVEGTNKWKEISDILKTHNRLSCRTRYLTISKFLSKNPSKTLKDVPSRLKTVTAIHRALLKTERDDSHDDDEEACVESITAEVSKELCSRSKSFGLLTFAEFKSKNPSIYNLLKTTYNYDLGDRTMEIDNVKFLVLKRLLNIIHTGLNKKNKDMFTVTQWSKLNEALNTKLEDNIVREIEISTKHAQFLMPPNYNTACGLRAIAIKMGDDNYDDDENIYSPNNPSKEYATSLENFQKLFFSLFYWTAMMSKIDGNEIRELHFLKYPKSKGSLIFEQINIFKRKIDKKLKQNQASTSQ